MAGFQRIFQHVFHFAPVTSTVWVQMQMISAAPCPSKLPQQQNSPGNLLSEKPGSHMLVLTSMCFNPKKELKSGNAGPAQEALAVGGFTTAELHHKKRKKTLWNNIQLLHTQNTIHNKWICAKSKQTELRELEELTQYFLEIIITYCISLYYASLFYPSFCFFSLTKKVNVMQSFML